MRYSNKVLAATILLLSLMIVISELNYSAAGKVAGAYWIYGHIHAFSAGDYIDGTDNDGAGL